MRETIKEIIAKLLDIPGIQIIRMEIADRNQCLHERVLIAITWYPSIEENKLETIANKYKGRVCILNENEANMYFRF